MSITILNAPGEISFSRNPVIYKVSTNKLYETSFIYPSIELTFSNKLASGDNFEFDFLDPETNNAIELLFIARLNPDGKGKEIPDDSFVGTLIDYINEVIIHMVANGSLSANYDIIFDGISKITLTAKQAIVELIPTSFSSVSGDVSEVILTNFLKPDRENIFILYELFFEEQLGSGIYKDVLSSSAAPDDDGSLNIDFFSALDAEILDSFETPPLADLANEDVFKNDLIRRYYVRFSESVNGILSAWEYDCVRIAHCGGVSKEDFAKQDPFDYIQANKRFLTWQSNNKEIHIDQKDWLTFINHTGDSSTFRVNLHVFFTDGSSVVSITALEEDLDNWESMTIPIGYNELDLGVISPAKTIYRYDVWITDTVTPSVVSEIRTYYVDCNFYECSNLLVYLNNYCSPESFLTRGEWKTSLKISRLFSEKTLPINYKIVNGQEFQVNQISKNFFDVRTGYLSKDYIVSLQSMLISGFLFLVDKLDYIPLTLDANSFNITECRKFLHTLDFKVNKSIQLNNYSKSERIPILVADFLLGLTGFRIDPNTRIIDSCGDLSIYDSTGTLIETVSSLPGNCVWNITDITKEGDYNAKAIVVVEGESIAYSKDIIIKNDHITYKNTHLGAHIVIMDGSTSADIYYDMNDTLGEQLDVGPNPIALATIYFAPVKVNYVDINGPDFSIFNSIDLTNQTVTEIDISKLINVEDILLSTNVIAGIFDVSEFKLLINLNMGTNSVTEYTFGFHPNIETIDISNNDIDENAIERILLKLWKWRKQYTFAGSISLDISGNPGSASYTATTLDIINGTGDFIGEGLVPNYTWLITI